MNADQHIEIMRAVSAHLPGYRIAAIDGETILWEDEQAPSEEAFEAALSAYAAGALGRAKAQAIARVIVRADAITAPIMSRYPEAERAGWPKREAEARAIVAAADTAAAIAETSVIKALAEAAAESTADTLARAQSIVAKADQFASISAAVEAHRHVAIAAIGDVEELEDLPAAVAAIEAQAAALEGSLGLG